MLFVYFTVDAFGIRGREIAATIFNPLAIFSLIPFSEIYTCLYTRGRIELVTTDFQWQKKKVLIVVKTYPTPANQGNEVSCTAAITENHEWIRLFPIPFRFLDGKKQFQKYQWIEASVCPSSDHRRESFRIDVDSIEILSEPLPTRNAWKARKEILDPMKSDCLCCLMEQQKVNKFPTLGLFKPKEITGFSLEWEEAGWTETELAKLNQLGFFEGPPQKTLEKMPFKFYYRFRCVHDHCKGHRMSCTDWEMGQAYRNFRNKYGSKWRNKFEAKFYDHLTKECDVHFFVGTVSYHPNSWIIVGLYYPPLVREVKDIEVEQMQLL